MTDTPSSSEATPAVRSSNHRTSLVIVVVLVVAVLAFLLHRGLTDAALYFRTVDEALAQRQELGAKRFRLEGTVVPGSVVRNGTFTDFTIASKGEVVRVHNAGQPVGVFAENIPVVLEGRFAENSNTFESDRIMVRHSAEYEAKYPDRVSGAANS